MKRKIKKKSCFMREYYQGHYEDPVWFIMKNSENCKEAEKEYVAMEHAFLDKLREISPDMVEEYSDVIGSLLYFQNCIIDEAYILGVKDRERSLLPQE